MASTPTNRCISSQTIGSYLLQSNYDGPCQMPDCILESTRSNYLPYILPIFPEKNKESQEYYPLRANVPNDQLLTEELARRQMALLNPTSRLDPKWSDSFNEIERRLVHTVQQWKLDPAIIIANLNRVLSITPLLNSYSFVRRLQEERDFEIPTKEWYWALEFYMHMDIDCFYMKMSSFHPTLSSTDEQQIFASKSPIAQFGMKRCRNRECRFCYERDDLTHRFESAMIFSPQQMHRFVNGYWIYLNADVTCETSNVLYALTCPCHQYDYLGRCKQPFRDRMREHRMESCRAMRDFLLGPLVMAKLQRDQPKDPFVLFNHRKMVSHSVHCVVAWNIFLKCQPKYWCFIPMTETDAYLDDQKYGDQSGPMNIDQTISEYERSSDLIRWCIDNLPTPPSNYRFSRRQRLEQYDFFRYRRELYPTHFLDMYNATIVVALPDSCSDETRHLIHALFVAFTQPKLNVMATSSGDPIPPDISCIPWCANLIHPL